MGGVVYRRLAVTIVADLNVVVAEITVMSSTSHPSLSPHRVSQNIYVEIWSQNILYIYIYDRRRAVDNNGATPGHYHGWLGVMARRHQ